ncbi:MAG TPA: glycosyltransferase 87 family protein [Solirubrobacteraceae bacterium]|nr:glycosyltransferase 87 family protein [Solirubrobacteraceae bacterium]
MTRAAPGLALAAAFLLVTTVGPLSDTTVSDLYLYGSVADLIAAGRVPYHDFGFEYPPLAALPMWLAHLPGGGEDGYAWAFGALMLACALALQRWTGALAGPRAAWLLVLLPVALGASIRTHYDLLPAAIVALALLLVARGRTTWAFAALGLGTVTKLYPVLLVPVAVAWLLGRGDPRAAARGVAAFAAVVLAVSLPFAGDGYVDQVRFHLERPVQIESTPASVLFALGDSHVTGHPVRPDEFKSNGLDGGPADAVAALFAAALAVVLASVAWLASRAGDVRHLVLCAFAAVLAFVALGKVLSPQFMVWLAPFAAVLAVWRAWVPAALCAAAFALTLVEFPGRYFDLVGEDTATIVVVAARNALLLAALTATLVALARSPSRADRRSG